MFTNLSQKLSDVFGRLTKRGILSESDITHGLSEIRTSLLQADVALPVVKDFMAKVKERATGQSVIRSVTPGQMIVKIVSDHLIELLGGDNEDRKINLNAVPPVAILMVGLQGSGKTTTTAKLGVFLSKRENKKVLMASLDTQRPAAQEQLKLLGEQANIVTLPIIAGQNALAIANRAMMAGRLGGYDIVLLDSAGRLSIDDLLMDEIKTIKNNVAANEVLLIGDSLTGQDAVKTATNFHQQVGITGIILTKVDGDGRGGAALSMRTVTNVPIKFLGVGETLDDLDSFDAKRIVDRILGMGDIVALVEKAAGAVEQEESDRIAEKLAKGRFDLNDFAQQLRQIRQMGGAKSVINLLPKAAQPKGAVNEIDDNNFKRAEAIISSMTLQERKNPTILQAKRKIRIAKGSGTSVQDINKILKQHMQMAEAVKRMSKLGQKAFMRSLSNLGRQTPQ